MEQRNIKNNLVIITKCAIPMLAIEKVKALKEKGINTIFYISYSGLGLLLNISHDSFLFLPKNLFYQ